MNRLREPARDLPRLLRPRRTAGRDRTRAVDDPRIVALNERLGLEVGTADVTPALPVLPGVGAIDEGLDWALVAEPGDISDVFENDQSFYILELISSREEGPLPFEDAAPTIRTLLVRNAQLEQARNALQPAVQRAQAGEPLADIARSYNATAGTVGPFSRSDPASGLGRLNAAVGAAIALRPGQLSPLVEADGMLFLIRCIEREDASRTAWLEQLEEQRAGVIQAMSDARWNQYLLALRENAKIVDKRNEVLRGGNRQAAAR